MYVSNLEIYTFNTEDTVPGFKLPHQWILLCYMLSEILESVMLY